MAHVPRALTISGSESGGGSGIQADLKTFAFFRVHGMCAVTAVAATDGTEVRAALHLPLDLVGAQVDVVALGTGVDACKTGFLPSAAAIELVAAKIRDHRLPQLVVDPDLRQATGDGVSSADLLSALKTMLLPLATVLTANVPQAALLVGGRLERQEDRREAARALHALGPKAVLLKGGQIDGEAVDLLYDGENFQEFRAERIASKGTHGAGPTLSAAIAASLAQRHSLADAVRRAKRFVTEAIRQAPDLGGGRHPLNHNPEL